ncbi:hypothetical protein [Rossellomorea sp. NPDC077527]|uniref:hypothetical protein n=1 Tax=Rossellomorea sp. NPDC077527 TaxID=3364510 RepID=UPI0037C7FE9A
MTVDEIIKTYAKTQGEAEGIEKMISMMMCLKKYVNLAELQKKTLYLGEDKNGR